VDGHDSQLQKCWLLEARFILNRHQSRRWTEPKCQKFLYLNPLWPSWSLYRILLHLIAVKSSFSSISIVTSSSIYTSQKTLYFFILNHFFSKQYTKIFTVYSGHHSKPIKYTLWTNCILSECWSWRYKLLSLCPWFSFSGRETSRLLRSSRRIRKISPITQNPWEANRPYDGQEIPHLFTEPGGSLSHSQPYSEPVKSSAHAHAHIHTHTYTHIYTHTLTLPFSSRSSMRLFFKASSSNFPYSSHIIMAAHSFLSHFRAVINTM
jgi:hypothetical protein